MTVDLAERIEALETALKKNTIGPALGIIIGTALGVLVTTVGALAYLNSQFMSKDVSELRFNALEQKIEKQDARLGDIERLLRERK